jgi:NAD(P)-dependent dehydrogenase (short-subunit alcohol dehydrogenase family)
MKNILVTGAYGGMGRAVTEALRKQGVRVFALDRAVGDPVENIIPVQADITTEAGVEAAVAVVRAHTPRLDAILHFAGVYMLDSLVEMDEAQFRRIFEVNLFGVYRVNKAFLPMLDRGGRILITTSELAPLDPLPFTGVYAVTKSALDKYAWALRMELQLLDISVSVLRAGAVDTGMLGASTDALDRFCAGTALYTCNAGRFRDIVARVEARCIPPEQLAGKVLRILARKNPGFAYSINRNPLLLLLNALPKGMQLWVIRKILT